MYQTEFAVVDLETTGLYPSRGDRIVEIGIVALEPHCGRRPNGRRL